MHRERQAKGFWIVNNVELSTVSIFAIIFSMVSLQLLDYVRQHLTAGVSKEDIAKSLIASGWQVGDINEAFASIANPSFVPQPAQSAQPVIVTTQSGNVALIPVGQLFADSWDLYKQRLLVLLTLFAIPYVFLLIGQLLSAAGNTILGSILMLICILFLIPTVAAVVFSISKGTGVFDSFRQGIRLFFPLLWVGILLEFVAMGGVIMFIIPALMMMIWFSLSIFTLVIENKRGLNALLQSHEYVRGYWWAIFGRLLLVYAIIFVPIFVLQLLVSLALGKTAGTIAYFLLTILLTPFSLAYCYKIYKSLTTLKPTLATTTPTSGRGFLIASGILGLLIPIIGIVAAIVLVALNRAQTLGNEALVKSELSATTTGISATLATTPYINTTAGYRITPPAGWQAQNTISNGKDNETFTEPAPNPSQANIAIVAAQNTNTTVNTRAGLDTAVQKIIAVYQIALPDFKLLSNTDSSVGSAPASLFLFTSKNSNGVPIESLVFLTVGGGHLYEAAAQATTGDWSTYEGLFRSVIASFSFTP